MLKTPLSTVLGGAFWTPGCTVIGGQQNLTQLIKSLFSSNEVGFAYDPNDFSTLYQDAAGTVPVTAVGQAVGLILDKSRNFGLGGELVKNGDFSNGLANWVAGTNASMTISNGELEITTNGTQVTTVNNSVYQSVPEHFAGKRYSVEFDATYVSGGNLSVGIQNQAAIIVTSAQNAGQKKRYVCRVSDVTTNSSRVVTFASQEGVSVWRIDNVSVKQVLGNHSYQAVSAARPILQRNVTTGAYYLTFDGVDDFLQTNSIDFTVTDKISLFTGVRKLSDTSTGIICENDSFYIAAPTGAGSPTVGSGFKVSTLRANSLNNYPAPVDMIVTAQGYTSNNVSSIRVNTAGRAINNGSQGIGNYSNSVMYIGRRVGVAAAFNGHLYGLIGIGRLTTGSETAALEKVIAKNVGVALNV